MHKIDYGQLGLEDNVVLMAVFAPVLASPENSSKSTDTASSSNASSTVTHGLPPLSNLGDARILVSTTHITFDPAKGDVKLGQLRSLMTCVSRLMEQQVG